MSGTIDPEKCLSLIARQVQWGICRGDATREEHSAWVADEVRRYFDDGDCHESVREEIEAIVMASLAVRMLES